MRISKTQARQNHDRVVAAAAELFRVSGFDGVAVSDLMKSAGFTHGGFYNHFDSKEALAAEALASAFAQMTRERNRAGDLEEMLGGYLSPASRRAPGRNCPAAALAGDVSRQPDAVKKVFADGVEGMIASVEALLPRRGRRGASRRERAIGVVAKMVGALALSRAVPSANRLAGELLATGLKSALKEARD
jgi:TetR/AcrR family transcriptional repressor of nem operon